jgi:hypothetical protein
VVTIEQVQTNGRMCTLAWDNVLLTRNDRLIVLSCLQSQSMLCLIFEIFFLSKANLLEYLLEKLVALTSIRATCDIETVTWDGLCSGLTLLFSPLKLYITVTSIKVNLALVASTI